MRPTRALEGAELVFVGYGIQAPEYAWDDFKGQDLRGKVLLMLNNDPEDDPALFAGRTRLWYGRWDYKYESAARVGAAGAIILHTPHSAGLPVAGGAQRPGPGPSSRCPGHRAPGAAPGVDHRGGLPAAAGARGTGRSTRWSAPPTGATSIPCRWG